MVDGWYTFISRHSLKFLSWQYAITDNQMASLWLQRALTLFGRRRLLALIEHVQPRLIITTHAMISYATARAIERLRNPVPLVFQLTDLERLHLTWFTDKRADAYLAPTREFFTQALDQGIVNNRLTLSARLV